jgi:hypothetical protein
LLVGQKLRSAAAAGGLAAVFLKMSQFYTQSVNAGRKAEIDVENP